MGTGFLRVQVTSGMSIVPVSGARVFIKDLSGNVLNELSTDENGFTSYAELFAPEAVASDNANYEGLPNAYYNIHVAPIDIYGGADVYNAEVFDGIKSTQPVYLYPKEVASGTEAPVDELYLPNEQGVRARNGIDPNSIPAESPFNPTLLSDPSLPSNVSTHNLLRNDELSDFNSRAGRAAEGYTVKIPEYVTVHLGTYQSDAQNVSVPFRDYIANVASHEIYPTWHTAALYANIYCHISFVLNRIYTVWYRSRGYNFDITNSTSTDQFFVYGGTIFDNIDSIVDEIFDIYCRREGHREPYFTEYCDGLKVHCPGLWQWGSEELATAGYTPLQILHYYYPEDLRLVEATEFTATNETYPGYPLSRGSNNYDVKIMQAYLNRITANYPGIPKIPNVDGVFGASTEESVRVFQQVFGLPVTGEIDKSTWYKITQIYVAVKKLAELTGEGEFIGIGQTPPTTTIRLGSKGEYVAQLQFLLNYAAYFNSAIPTVVEDSTFGQTTQDAVKAFQSETGLTPDGVVGPGTWRKLYELYWEINKTDPLSLLEPAYPGVALRIGSKNDNVRLIQQYLNKIGETYPTIPALTVDGSFGNGTYNAVIAFQKLFGLTQDGVVGKDTWNKIVYAYQDSAPEDGYTEPYPGHVLKVGVSDQYVSILQDHINRLSKSLPSVPPVTIDGKFGAGTQAAVIELQKLLGITADGVVGQTTWDKIATLYLGQQKYAPPYPGTALRQGSRGPDVVTVQKYINAIAKAYPTLPTLTEDGVFGSGTRDAVIRFQQIFGLGADGVVGGTTWNKLVSIYNILDPTGGIPKLSSAASGARSAEYHAPVSRAADTNGAAETGDGYANVNSQTVSSAEVKNFSDRAAIFLAIRLFTGY
ncbi:MAG: peptidoglycan-binding protein [Clostridiales bacterium]|jgi:peptidoglycan hydrolase-like protein with peptidoglycan-binding domain|nr:peptidoglycan-binding protein [Clostridiales bacterium]